MPSDNRMYSFLVFTVLLVGCQAYPVLLHYSFSNAVGRPSGISFSTSGIGKITAVRIWERERYYITGFQLSHNNISDEVVGRIQGTTHELVLFENEVITQVSGKYDYGYIYELIFQTSRGRSLKAGQPIQASFNIYATHPDAELIQLSGTQNGNGITSLAAHWGKYEGQSNSTDISL